jgi:hypothetical protein
MQGKSKKVRGKKNDRPTYAALFAFTFLVFEFSEGVNDA